MSKHDEADLILKLYELRRDPTMRKARDWYVRDFNPKSAADIWSIMFTEHGAHLRMVMSYWDMAAALVNHGAISLDLFNETNGEHYLVFSKLEPVLAEARTMMDPNFLKNLEKLIDATPGGRERTAKVRERMKGISAEMSARETVAASS